MWDAQFINGQIANGQQWNAGTSRAHRRAEWQPMNAIRRTSAVVVTSAALLVPFGMAIDGAESADRESIGIDNIIARADRPPVRYRALRHLEAKSAKAEAWLDAWTEFDPAKGFSYAVVDEGGSGRIRNSVLRAVLDAERQSAAASECRRGALSVENYQFHSGGRDEDGALKLLLIPRRKDSRLIDGALFVGSDSGDPLRIEGQLARSPSFWVRSVIVAWRYARVGDVPMPIEVQSQAQVKFYGSSTFSMTYDYQMVDGIPVGNLRYRIPNPEPRIPSKPEREGFDLGMESPLRRH